MAQGKALTEAQWLASKDLVGLVSYLRRFHNVGRTKSGRRKLRLFACACCRTMIWHVRVKAGYCGIVEAAEAHADGLIGKEELASKLPAWGEFPEPTWGHAWYASV